MKNKNLKKILMIFSVCMFFLLVFYNIKFVEKEKDQEKDISNNSKKKIVTNYRRNYDYSDMLATLDKCGNKFILTKINKTETSNNKINVEITYEGEVEGFINSVNQLKSQEIVDSINEINILREDEGKCTAEVKMNFYKVK